MIQGFHLRDGFYFRRENDRGDVTIIVTESNHADAPILRQLTVPENEWASVVTSVSARSENGVTWQAARDLHAGLEELS